MTVATFHANIRAGIRQHLLTLSGLPVVAWEGKQFTPKTGVPWIREQVRPVSSSVRGLGRGGYIAHTVTANFSLFYPPGVGTVALDAMAGSILQLFRPGTVVAYQGASAVIQQAERLPNVQEPDWINCPVVITLIGHTAN